MTHLTSTLRQIANELHDAGMTGTYDRLREAVEKLEEENTMNPPDTPIKTTDWMSGEPLYSVDTVKALEKERDAAQTRIAELEEQLANEQARGVHTCHDGCERPLCKANRELRAAQAEVGRLKHALDFEDEKRKSKNEEIDRLRDQLTAADGLERALDTIIKYHWAFDGSAKTENESNDAVKDGEKILAAYRATKKSP